MALVLGWNRNLEKWEYPKGFNEITDKNHNRCNGQSIITGTYSSGI